ncbi:hypothetical protein [Rhizobium leguminosarum]|uniref:hypothetical protein n=1 Tax=Rhizobium leguminosarum TaxID=384 RepID=UPI001C911271|nr:hypothetical protein [Rhizobium leguminosarum]MBY2914153.1 hypothetical protein [Rhizobium leguminosarum]MBY2969692.1 hypothetical protein [Rhizobium leguminosarum]MBY2977065.1 hypothetical protein [Rhizobium leguminosarum]MBY3005615.1 hypothetical protein [Rhizobium leguminosarum]
MGGFLKQFDFYTIRARIYPALLAGLPSFALLFIGLRWDHLRVSNVIVGSMSLLLLFALADIARRAGRSVETRLGTRGTPELWLNENAAIDRVSKDRYKAFVAQQLGVQAPTSEIERENQAAALDFYRSAGNWLRDQTRDTKKFSILFNELVTYGFRRNLLGLKWLALALNALVLVVCIIASVTTLPYSDGITYFGEKMAAVTVAVVLHSAYIILGVTERGVRDASTSYGIQLILSCETLMKPRKGGKKSDPSPRG